MEQVGDRFKIEAAARVGFQVARQGPLRGVERVIALQAVAKHIFAGFARAVHERGGRGVVEAGDQRAIERDQSGEGFEGRVHILEGGITIGMVVLDVGDDGNERFQAQEHAVVFVRFDDEGTTLARPRVGLQVGERGTDDERRVAAEGEQHPCDHGAGGGLAVRASHGDADLVFHQATEEIRALVDRDAARARFLDLGIVVRNGGGAHHPVRARHVVCVVPDEDSRAVGLQLRGKRGQDAVRAGDGVSHLQQEARDGG